LIISLLRPREFPQKYFFKVACFSPLEIVHLATTIHHPITTNSPAKNQTEHALFSKPPSKKPAKPQKLYGTHAGKKFLKKQGLG
jgi:hypothetical protein